MNYENIMNTCSSKFSFLYMHSEIQMLLKIQQLRHGWLLYNQRPCHISKTKRWTMYTTLEHLFKWASFFNTCSILSLNWLKGQKWNAMEGRTKTKATQVEEETYEDINSWRASYFQVIQLCIIFTTPFTMI